MTTKFYVVKRENDWYGRDWSYVKKSEYFDTEEEAKNFFENMEKDENIKIMRKTMDEIAFEVVENEIFFFDYYKEVYRFEDAERGCEYHWKKIVELEEARTRCRTENGLVKKDKEIAYHKEELARYEKILAER